MIKPASRESSKIRPVTNYAGNAHIMLSARDSDPHCRDIEKQYLHAIRSAQRRLVIANDSRYLGERCNGRLANTIGVVYMVVVSAAAIAASRS